MATHTATLKAQFDLQTRLFNNVTEGITDSESGMRTHASLNNVKWIAGHMLHYRLNTMKKFAGLQPDDSYGAQFGKGSALDANAIYPSMEELSAKWRETAPAISEAIGNMPQEVLVSKAAVQTPIADINDTVEGLLAFLLTHEATHIGQLSMLRKMMGKSAMSFR